MYHQSDESDLDGRERRSERYNSYGFGVDVDGNVVVKVEGEFVIPSCVESDDDRPLTPPADDEHDNHRSHTPQVTGSSLSNRITPFPTLQQDYSHSREVAGHGDLPDNDEADRSSSSPSEPDTPSPTRTRDEVSRMIDRLHTRDQAKARRKARKAAADQAAIGSGSRRVSGGQVNRGDAGRAPNAGRASSGGRQAGRVARGKQTAPVQAHDNQHILTQHLLPARPATTSYPLPHLVPQHHLPPINASTDPYAQPLRIRVEPTLLQFASAQPSDAAVTHAPEVTPTPHVGGTVGALAQRLTHTQPQQQQHQQQQPVEVQLAVISSANLAQMQWDLDNARLCALQERSERKRVVRSLHALCTEAHDGDTTYDRMDRIRRFATAEMSTMAPGLL